MTKLDLRTVEAKLRRKGIATGPAELLPGGHIRLQVYEGGAAAGLILPATSVAPRTADNAVAWAKGALRRAKGRGSLPPAPEAGGPAPADAGEPDIRYLHGRQEARPRSRPPAWLGARRGSVERAAPTARQEAPAGPPAADRALPALHPQRAAPLPPAAFCAAFLRMGGGTTARLLADRVGRLWERWPEGRQRALHDAAISAMLAAAGTVHHRVGRLSLFDRADHDPTRLQVWPGPGMSVIAGLREGDLFDGTPALLEIVGAAETVAQLLPRGTLEELGCPIDPRGLLLATVAADSTAIVPLTERQKREWFAVAALASFDRLIDSYRIIHASTARKPEYRS